MPASTALAVLGSCSLRWSSPLLFNDPFDVPRELGHGLSNKDLAVAGARRIADLINNPPQDTSELNPQIRMVVELVKNGIPQTLKDEMLQALVDSENDPEPAGKSRIELQEKWREMIPNYRILCFTESYKHTAMWHHYADRYRGAVFGFSCIDELDSAWLVAEKVRYPVEKPDVYTADGWARIMTLEQMVSVKKIMDLAANTKTPEWSYENEWRVTSFKKDGEGDLYTDFRFKPQELTEIYLGPMMDNEDISRISTIARLYPSVKLWKASIGMSRELEFIEVEA